MKPKIGIIGIIGKELQADLPGTLHRLRELGYAGIELGFAGMDKLGGMDTVATALGSAGMELITLHTLREPLRDNLQEHLGCLAATGCRHVTVSWSPADSEESIAADAALYREIAPAIHAAGARLCYHHHDHEFRIRFNAHCALDRLLAAAGPEVLQLHADIAWAAFGGVQPAALIERHAGRVPLVHLKDLHDLSIRGCFTALGTGLVDIPAALHAARAAGVEWLTVEQDSPRRLAGFDLATASILNLREFQG
ncbi:MAG: sugar phosphate isomerase/epimerase family protein [Oceanipulchritudo sp.]